MSKPSRYTQGHCERAICAPANEAIAREMAFRLDLADREERRVGFTQRQEVAQFIAGSYYTTAAIEAADCPRSLAYLIALQLLASCYTTLPASSADCLPFFHQRKEPELITTLRLHSLYRFAPAAGHHARHSSETSCWPGLYKGPCLEDLVAEAVSERRRLGRCRDRESNFFTAIGTSPMIVGETDDGQERRIMDDLGLTLVKHRYPEAAYEKVIQRRFPRRDYTDGNVSQNSKNSPSTASTSSLVEARGLFSMLSCAPSSSRGARRKLQRKEPRRSPTQTGRTALRNISSFFHTKPIIPPYPPSSLPLRRTQSSPRKHSSSTYFPLSTSHTHRNSSTPVLNSYPPVNIPEIHRTSATTAGYSDARVDGRNDSQLPYESISAYPDGSKLSSTWSFSAPRRGSSAVVDAISPKGTTVGAGYGETTAPGYFALARRNSPRDHGVIDEDEGDDEGSLSESSSSGESSGERFERRRSTASRTSAAIGEEMERRFGSFGNL